MHSPLILPFEGATPIIDKSAFIAPTATIIGDVVVGPETSIWYGVTLRGDVNSIRIGARTNIQDGSVVHVTEGKAPTVIGDDVLVGHMAMIHGCTLESGSFVGMKACILDHAVVEGGGMVAAGALLGSGKRVPRGALWGGVPARKLRNLSPQEIDALKEGADHYVDLARRTMGGR